jgi:hypothetical protein
MTIKFNRKGMILQVDETHLHWNYSNPGLEVGETQLTQIQTWCEQTGCGRRTSFDMFKFRNNEEITMFLLKWS